MNLEHSGVFTKLVLSRLPLVSNNLRRRRVERLIASSVCMAVYLHHIYNGGGCWGLTLSVVDCFTFYVHLGALRMVEGNWSGTPPEAAAEESRTINVPPSGRMLLSPTCQAEGKSSKPRGRGSVFTKAPRPTFSLQLIILSAASVCWCHPTHGPSALRGVGQVHNGVSRKMGCSLTGIIC